MGGGIFWANQNSTLKQRNMGKDDPSKRFINEQKKISNDKLVFLKVISNVIKSGMDIVGVDTPQKM